MTNPDTSTKELRELKTQISEHILQDAAERLDITVEEYGSVYNSEKHEDLLNRIMREVIVYSQALQSAKKDCEVKARIDELESLYKATFVESAIKHRLAQLQEEER